MTGYNFDEVIDRRNTCAVKYGIVDDDVLPLWVADMDFPAPDPVIEALHRCADQRIFGYTLHPPELPDVLRAHLLAKYNWQVAPEAIVFVPGVVPALNIAIRAYGQPGDGVLMQPPVYPPFIKAPPGAGQRAVCSELVRREDRNRLYYEIDFDDFERAASDERTRLFSLCSPHNPVGRVWTRDELARMAEICLKHDVIICSDEIHCDLLFDDNRHIPTATLAPEVAARTITLMAPSKTYNVPGLGFSFAIIEDEALRQRFVATLAPLGLHVNAMGYAAGLAAYRDGQPWLDAVLRYMQANRDYTTAYIDTHFPEVRVTHPEGTYLSWLDVRTFNSGDEVGEGIGAWIDPFFLKNARVALNNGLLFGDGGQGFARLNFATPRSILTEALERMHSAVQRFQAVAGK